MSEGKDQSAGRKANAAQPLGQREGDDTNAKAKAQGKREQGTAGPDGPDAKAIGDTFKRK
jgi:hypothetical protein